MLTLATAAVAAIKPENFECTTNSPVEPAVFSDTTPPVALTHTFCGNIAKKSSKVQGFHHSHVQVHRVGQACARAIEPLWCADGFSAMEECTCCFYSKEIEVYNGKGYVEKKTNNMKAILTNTFSEIKKKN